MDAGEFGTMETLLIGIDAAAPRVLADLFDDAVLPHLQSIRDRGVMGPLDSQIPPWTASAWPSLYTGVNPGKHGVYDFLTFDGYDWDVVDRTAVREHAIWELLSEYGLCSVVVNVPVTHPARPFTGALIPGYTAPHDPVCHPEGILEDVEETLGSYHVYDPRTTDSPSPAERIAGYRELTKMRGRAFRYLADRFDPDFGFVQFQQTDSVFHELDGDEAAVRDVFGTVDEEIGLILDQCNPTNVIVASDHGIGEYSGWEFRINEHLREHGYVQPTRRGEGMPSWTAIERNEFRGDSTRPVQALARVMELAAALGLTSQRIQTVLRRMGLAEAVAGFAPPDIVRAGSQQVDFASSTAYARSRVELGIRINLSGREPEGTVAPDEYERVRDDLIELYSGLRTPDGTPVFEDVLPREAVFHGPYLEAAPDVVTVPAGYDHKVTTSLLGDQFVAVHESWDHKPTGVFMAAGPAVSTDEPVESAHLFDVAPTVLATMDVPASDRMDGRPLPVVEATGSRAYPGFAPATSTGTTDRAVERRLADLGYLE